MIKNLLAVGYSMIEAIYYIDNHYQKVGYDEFIDSEEFIESLQGEH